MVSAVIVAGGRGKRMASNLSKQYIEIGGKEIVARTLEVFQNSKRIDEIIFVVPGDDIEYCNTKIINRYSFSKVKRVIPGGEERQASVYKGIKCCNKKTDLVVIHDGVRPFIDDGMINTSIECAENTGACTMAIPLKDTIKVVDKDGFSIETPDRKKFMAIQTPQAFKYDLIFKAHEKARKENFIGTDDSILVERLGHRVKTIMGSYFNIKITTKEDIVFANAILQSIV